MKNRNIEVILLQDNKHLGEKYEIVAVKPIFARNVLLPQNIAVLADKANRNKYEQKMQAAIATRAKKAASLEELFAKMAENGGVSITRKANKDRVLYAKVHESDIVEAIKETYGIEVDSHLFKLKKKINEAGTYVIPFMYKEMKKELTVVVHAELDAKATEQKAEEKQEVVVEKTKEELKAERDAKRAAEKAEKIAKLKEKYK
ncbi:MAG: 50S ribosomal protein L9 [bacterium]|nr:50S ribosomal protein L9 [bacterium]